MIDRNLSNLIAYARKELNEAERLGNSGEISDDEVFVRLVLIGKSLVGWDDEIPVSDAMNQFLEINETVNVLIRKPAELVS